MFYNKEQLERMRKQGEEAWEQIDSKNEKFGHEYKANDIKVSCIHCKHDKFELGKALLNTRGMTFFDIEWLNEGATTLICKRCGYIHWFRKEVIQIDSE